MGPQTKQNTACAAPCRLQYNRKNRNLNFSGFMNKNTKTLIFASLLLTVAFVGTYINFTMYKPKAIKQVQDVKGLQTTNPGITLPEGAEKIGVNRASGAEQTTFHTNKSKKEIQDFYKTIFISGKWELESQNSQDGFMVSRYRKGSETVNVITLDINDEYKTLVSLEASSH
jgi:hypothetical protein